MWNFYVLGFKGYVSSLEFHVNVSVRVYVHFSGRGIHSLNQIFIESLDPKKLKSTVIKADHGLSMYKRISRAWIT